MTDNSDHVTVIAIPDTGKMMIIGYRTDRAGGGVIVVSIGRLDHDEPDAHIELGASHAATAIKGFERAIAGLVHNLGD
jgi:hypothetical protein